MKLKYYLRGLGAGMILSTVILSFILGKQVQVELTEEQIIERAEALGMEKKKSTVNVDYDAINQSINGSTEVDSSSEGENANDKSEENISGVNTENEKENQAEETDVSDEEKQETISDNKESNETTGQDIENSTTDGQELVIKEQPITKTIVIRPGMTANQVSKLLEDQGVISSANEFRLYLIDQKLTEKIISKKIEIEVNATFKEIATMITDREN